MAVLDWVILFWLLFLILIKPVSSNLTMNLPEFRDWAEDRYIDCIFCIDYDNFKRISVTGCASSNPVICKGNMCFMRQHKSNVFFLYTSGCLNLTKSEFKEIEQERKQLDGESKLTFEETLLCEVSKKSNTCLCTDSARCNNVSLTAPFSEFHTSSLFSRLQFHEMLHFRMFIPNEPVLRHSDISELDQLLHYYVPGYSSSSNPLVYIVLLATLIRLLL
ncbi:hypothetical protein Y032_0082g1570 [Ancylostoma ceylanicum]|uniref:Uncharacterized protein n=1 Tax=Ancylostoma ceylanicum TaxID=53326 RepID=A0A016TRN6_9BILA|nr:hypothetical protein Y032_0082g1570 [Ancylostoma ceylanicum]